MAVTSSKTQRDSQNRDTEAYSYPLSLGPYQPLQFSQQDDSLNCSGLAMGFLWGLKADFLASGPWPARVFQLIVEIFKQGKDQSREAGPGALGPLQSCSYPIERSQEFRELR